MIAVTPGDWVEVRLNRKSIPLGEPARDDFKTGLEGRREGNIPLRSPGSVVALKVLDSISRTKWEKEGEERRREMKKSHMCNHWLQ